MRGEGATMLGFDHHDLRMLGVFFSMKVRDKYLGSRLGLVWAVASPLLMLSLFTFIFGYVLRVRMPDMNGNLAYTLWLISGYGPWLATTEGLVAASTSVVSGAGMVKNMAFKTELLPISAALTGVIPLAVSLGFLTALLAADGQFLSWSALVCPVLVVLHFGFLASLGCLLSAVAVFVRDFIVALPNLLLIILFATPILYPLSMTPDFIQTLSALNPFYIISDGYRRLLLEHHVPDPLGLVYVAGVTLVVGLAGLRVFRRHKAYFDARL